MNPFQDDTFLEETKRGGNNPFEEDDTTTNNSTTAAEAYEDMLVDSTPAEASWQYLGDLPYRRIPIYKNVTWDNQVDLPGLASYNSAGTSGQSSLHFSNRAALLNKTTITKCAGCPNGGPMALLTLPLLASSSSTTTQLRVLTMAGSLLCQQEFPSPRLGKRRYAPSDVLNLGFTSRCILVIVFKDSLCVLLNTKGEPIMEPFKIMENAGVDLKMAHIYDGGVAVLAHNQDSALVELLDQFDDPEYASHQSHRKVTSADNQHYVLITPFSTSSYAPMIQFCAVAVLPRARTLHKHPEIFLSTSDNSVVIVNAATTESTDVECRNQISSPIVAMSFAPNGRFLACFTESSMLTVISTNFETKVLDFDTSEGSNSPPLEMEWCGEDSVVLHWKNLGVLMVGPYGDWLRFPYENTDHLFLLSEIDCCRVVTDSAVEILQRVPPATALLLRIGSIETSAMLLDASDAYHSGSQTSEEAARAILETGLLEEAIETCTDSATKEFDIATQKRLLRAASYGMHFAYKKMDREVLIGGPFTGSDPESGVLPSHTAYRFVSAARKLRVLNALRHPGVGFLLTAAQFDSVSATGVVARLVGMGRPALAAEISKYLNLPKTVQLFARAAKASAFVESAQTRDISDSETAERAIQIINGDETEGNPQSMNRGGYAAVALAANKAGRPGVANLLLMMESSVADKVPALISTGAYSDAVAVATSARDPDFIFSTLMDLERSCLMATSPPDIAKANSTFLQTVVSKFTLEGFHVLRRYLQCKGDTKSLTSLLLKAQKAADAGNAIAMRGLKEDDYREKLGMLSEASRIFGLGKETAFNKASTDDYLELLKDQETLRNKYGAAEVAPYSSSVTDTIMAVLKFAGTTNGSREQHRLMNDADKLYRKFRIAEKRFWHIKVKAFSESDQWSSLRAMVENRKPPIGYKPFARAAVRGKRPESEIMRYIDSVTIPEERYDLLCEASMWLEALKVAESMKDARRILTVKSLCNDQTLQLRAEEMMARLA